MTVNRPSIVKDESPSIAERFNRPYGRKRYRFDLAISADQLKDQLKRDTSALAGIPFMQKPFKGKVEESCFQIAWGRNNTRNSMAPVAVGKIIPNGEACAVEFEFEVEILTRASFIFIFIILFVVLLNAFIFSAPSVTVKNQIELGILGVVTPVAVVIGCFVGIRMGQNDIAKILKYFRDLPGSKESSPVLLIE